MKEKPDILDLNPKETYDRAIYFIRSYMMDLKKEGIIVGLSGGIDSCLILKLCAEAIGREKVLAVILPERDSSPKNMKDAVRYARSLKVRFVLRKITAILWLFGVYRLYPPTFFFTRRLQASFVKKQRSALSKKIGKDIFIANLEGYPDSDLNKAMAFYRIKHRFRSSILFYYAELNNYLLVGTANKTEWLTGFFVKYGDNIADIMPISNLYKTQVFDFARYLKIDAHIIEKSPSPDLIPGVIDEDMLGLPYKKLDLILFGIENNHTDDDIVKIAGASQDEIERVREIIEKSEYLRAWPILIH